MRELYALTTLTKAALAVNEPTERCCEKPTRRFPWFVSGSMLLQGKRSKLNVLLTLLATRRCGFLPIHGLFSVVAPGRSRRAPRTLPRRLFPAGSHLVLRFDPQGFVRRFDPFESKVAARWLAPGWRTPLRGYRRIPPQKRLRVCVIRLHAGPKSLRWRKYRCTQTAQ